MLTSLLPGLRDLRAPLAAGFVWLVALWFVFEPHWDREASADGIVGSANRLMSTVNVLGQGLVLSFAAYLIGSFSVFIFSRPLLAQFRPSIEPSGRPLEGLSDLARVSLSQVAVDGRKRLEAALTLSGVTVDDVLGVSAPVPDVPSKARPSRGTQQAPVGLTSATVLPTPEEVQEREIKERVLRDLPVVANAQLLGRETDVFAAVDRNQSEVEFRVALVPAILALAVAMAWTAAPELWWSAPVALFVGGLGATGLMLDAARGRRDSNELILSLMEHGRITSPSVARAESEATSRADTAPAVVLKRQGDETARIIRRYLASLEAVPSSGSLLMLEQAHSAALLARKSSRDLDGLLHQHLGMVADHAESVLEPVDRALSGWTRVNASLADQLTPAVGDWDGVVPVDGDTLRQLVDEGRERYARLMDEVRTAVTTVSERSERSDSPDDRG